MEDACVREGLYGDERAVTLCAGPYEATVLPGIGGHVVALRDTVRDLRLLREPLDVADDLAAYRRDPIPYGIPLLFPPNRIADGTFTCCGETYRLPINEPARHNSLHGFFARGPWQVSSLGARGGVARLLLRRQLRAGDEEYGYFPHRLTLALSYELSGQGLRHAVRVRNDGDRPAPLMVGFHTALRVPFAAAAAAGDCDVFVSIGEKWQLSLRGLPTGRRMPRDLMEEAIAQGHGDAGAQPIDALFSAQPRDGRNLCRVRDRSTGLAVMYATDAAFRNWMLWNGDAQSGFFCAEPMTCLVNAPNLDLPWDVSGMRTLAPGASWVGACTLGVEPPVG